MDPGNLKIIELVSRQFLTVILSSSLRSLIIFFCAYIMLLGIKRTESRMRHFLWLLSIVSFIAVPVLSLLLQQIKIGFFSLPETPGRVYRTFSSLVAMDFNPPYNFHKIHSLVSETHHASGTVLPMIRWTFGLLIWTAGTVAVCIRLLFGTLHVRKIFRTNQAVEEYRILSLLRNIRRENNISVPVRLYSNIQAVSPFTIGCLKPVIVLPAEMTGWSPDDLRPVLVHELYHIKRKDHLIQIITNAVCSVFWFMPAVWFARKKLYMEQESLCDEAVICSGVQPRHYVLQMLRIARPLINTAVSPGAFIVRNRTQEFERRIITILKKQERTMKKKTFFLLGACFFIIFSIIAGCTTTGKALSEKDFFKTWSGTWVNGELAGNSWEPQKIMANPDGTYDAYVFLNDTISPYHYELTLKDLWTGKDGTIWYTAHWEIPGKDFGGYEYGKISNSGNTLERLNHSSEEPIKKWEPDNEWYNYCIYYRE